MMAIELCGVSKRFKETLALDQVNVSFDEAKIYGLLGNNGAGKTTLMNIVANRLYADQGQVLIDGEPVADLDRALSKVYLLGEKNLYGEDMRVKKALAAAAHFYPDFELKRALAMAKQFGLNIRKKIGSLSTGYASIFKLIIALNVNTPYLLLDEPVLGLDAQHRDSFYKLLLQKYAERPCTIVISTHLIAEVANLIEHTVIIRDGRILENRPTEELLAVGYTISGPAAAVDDYIAGKSLLSQSALGGLKTACLTGRPQTPLPDSLELGKLNLQDYFIQLMNREEHDNG
ncbi:MAG: ABC transporter ATP-binding protein [Clostridia bacterium]|nr:ABC transporter ATP-binding protein [Clostridia bacterium]